MNINIIADWVEVELIQYLIVGTVILGLIYSIKQLMIRR